MDENIIQLIKQKGSYYRGIYINEVIELETLINIMLAKSFTRGKKEEHRIVELLIDRMTFEAKRTALKTILDKIEQEGGFVKTKAKKYPHAKLIEDIRLSILVRNYFAHYMLEISEQSIKRFPDEVGFVEFRDSKNTKWFTEEKLLASMKRLSLCSRELINIIKKIDPNFQ